MADYHVRKKAGTGEVQLLYDGGPVERVNYHASNLVYGFQCSGSSELALTLLTHYVGLPARRMNFVLNQLSLHDWEPLERFVWDAHLAFRNAVVAKLNRDVSDHFVTRPTVTTFVRNFVQDVNPEAGPVFRKLYPGVPNLLKARVGE
jgi:hypothetical protein